MSVTTRFVEMTRGQVSEFAALVVENYLRPFVRHENIYSSYTQRLPECIEVNIVRVNVPKV